MKEGSYSIEIVPSSGYLDFYGPQREHASSESSQILKGNVIMKLSKTIKVKTITVKFKGYSQVQQYAKSTDTQPQHSISIPLLPKLKTKVLSKSVMLPVGDHVFPWELEIPNIYPRTFSTASKKGSIQYQVELKVSQGINKKAIMADHPIIIRRHLISSSQEQTSNIRTNTYENASSKFRYEIEAPTTISAAQPYIPISIKANRPCMFIYTQLIQTEIYRCRNISKAEADMAAMASKKTSTMVGGQIYESFKNGDVGLSKFFKRIQPVTLNTIDPEADVLPLLLLHNLRENSLLTPGIESPLISIYHQLEVTFNFGSGQQHDEIRAKIPVLVSSVPESVSKVQNRDSLQPNTLTATEKYLMEKQLHRMPLSVEVIDTNLSLDKKLSNNRSTIEDPDMAAMSASTLVVDEDRSIKKSVSDQNMQQTMVKDVENEKRRSITPPPSFTKPNMINTQLANTLESSMSLTSPYTPTRPTLVSSRTSQSADLVLQPPIESFSGLLPPPRRARKKESPASLSGDEYSGNRSASSASSRSALPLPPLPTNSSNSSIGGGGHHSRPTSPMSISLSTTGGGNGNYHAFKHNTSSDYISTPPQSPLPPSTPRTLLRLNQSRSSCTTSSIDSQLSRKRSNSTNNENFIVDDYARSITSHYCSADLPPIPPAPPAITRQKLPSLPNVDKDENRKTRMYYEDESDDEEDDDEDYTFFLQQTFK